MKKKVVFIDFSGVVASPGYLHWAQEHISEQPDKQLYIADIFNKVDYGNIQLKELNKLLSERSGISEEKILSQVLKTIMVDREVLTLITKIKIHCTVALLTNYSYEVLEIVLKEKDLGKIFDNVIVSSRHGKVKPNRDLFEIALNSMNVTPNEAIFIDDSIKNIQSAENIGITALHFINAEKLEKELRELQIIY